MAFQTSVKMKLLVVQLIKDLLEDDIDVSYLIEPIDTLK